MSEIKIGDIYWVNFQGSGSEQNGWKPGVIVQNNIGNKFSPTLKIVPLTSRAKNDLPTHVKIKAGKYGIVKDSTILCEQETVCDKSKLGGRIGTLPPSYMRQIAVSMTINTPVIGYLDEKSLLALLDRVRQKNSPCFAA